MASVTYNAEEITDALMAMIASAGSATRAKALLEQQEKRAPAVGTLREWVTHTHWQQYQELRDKWAAQIETGIVNDYRDAIRSALEAELLAIEKAKERLENNKDEDPARTAANLARAAQSSTDKMMTMQGKPTQISETRDVMEIMRGLVAMGVLQVPEGPAGEIPEASSA